jgi:hypothetical protein
LEMIGGSMSRGSVRWAWETLAWTSCRAKSTFREMSSSRVTEGGALPGHRDRDVGEIDIGELADADP